MYFNNENEAKTAISGVRKLFAGSLQYISNEPICAMGEITDTNVNFYFNIIIKNDPEIKRVFEESNTDQCNFKIIKMHSGKSIDKYMIQIYGIDNNFLAQLPTQYAAKPNLINSAQQNHNL
jgi:hypothetical protein